MTVISERFVQLRSRHECAFIPFITAGDPDLETTEKALLALDRNGADFIELGVPYSDPLADGPVIQAAATRALERGVKLKDVLDIVSRLQGQLRAPIILFTYYNPILNRGIDTFLQQIAAAGVQGLVVPDLSLEESEPLSTATDQLGIDLIQLVAPTSSSQRVESIAQRSQGFIYLVSVTGVTGMRQQMGSRVSEMLQQLRDTTQKPIGVGFGISQPDHAQQVRDWGADAVIVGSALVKRLADQPPAQGLAELAQFCQSLKTALARSGSRIE
jgi:tryptophan synthase alpha chain